MIPFHRQILLKLAELIDLLIMTLSFVLALAADHYYRTGTIWLDYQFFSMRVKVQNVAIFIGFFVLWHTIFSMFGLYHSRRLATRKNDIIDPFKATCLGSLTILVAGVALSVEVVTPVFLAVFWCTSSVITICSRIALSQILKRIRLSGRNLRHLLIVGTNPRAVSFARRIEAKPEVGYRLLGFADDRWPGIGDLNKTGCRLVAALDELPAFFRNQVVDEVVVGLPMGSFYQQGSRIVALCEEQGIIVRFLSSIFNPKLARFSTEYMEDDSVITLYTGAMAGGPVIAKRALDFSLSLILLIILVPLFVIVALLIKITSPGSVFFIQERVGLNKRRFCLYKFRTMVPGAEQNISKLVHLNEVSGPVFKIKNDPRLTPIGKFLRKTSIDELPQLINVLTGQMSLVGPRPLPVRDYEGFDQDWIRRRFSVRPGITCLWQIAGRSSIPFNKWMELDMEYIDQWSLSLDLKILAKTIPAVLRGTGAA